MLDSNAVPRPWGVLDAALVLQCRVVVTAVSAVHINGMAAPFCS